MDKIGLIIWREYLTRVRKKTFLVMTILGPLLFAGIVIVPQWLASRDGEEKIVEVIDDSGLFASELSDDGEIKFRLIDRDIESAKQDFLVNSSYGLLHIPKMDVDNPKGIVLYSLDNPSFTLKKSLESKFRGQIENLKLIRSGIDQETLDGLKAKVTISTINLSKEGEESESSSEIASIVGYVSSFLIYFFIFFYGAQIMRGVIEEKSNKIIEVIISSVKPFQLMMGKIIGVGAVGLTQFLLWVILTFVIAQVGAAFFGSDTTQMASNPETMEAINEAQMNGEDVDFFNIIFNAADKINVPLILACFLFYFLGGYLLYGALFAAVGSAVDSDADSQQFMFPITVPLIFSIISLAAVLKDPNGTLATWMSMIPFTSPVVMMMRIPFDIPGWQIVVSMILLIVGFVFTTWFAGRIYRVGIFMHGSKVNYKVLAKWFMMKI